MSTHTDLEGSCPHNPWDQCLIYVETAEIFTFLEPAPPQFPPGLNTPGSELVSGLGAPRCGQGKLDPTLQAANCAPEARPLVHRGDPAQTYLLTCRAQWLLRPALRPAVQTPPAALLTSASLAGGSGSPAPHVESGIPGLGWGWGHTEF